MTERQGRTQLTPGAGATVRVPASSANLGSGFDTIGLGLDLWDEYQVEVTTTPGLEIDLAGEGADHLPRGENLLVAKALKTGLQVCGVPWLSGLERDGLGLRLTCRNTIQLSAGLGSSAAALVGGLGLGFALHRGGELSAEDLAMVNTHAGLLEGHPDNSSASVYGGLTLSWMPSRTTVRTARPDLHQRIEPVVLIPTGDRLPTRTARAALPTRVAHTDAVLQASRSGVLVHALSHAPDLLHDATQDWLHQEYRRAAYPTSMAAVDLLRSLGHAATISGAGPSVLVLALRETADSVVAEASSWGQDWIILRPGVAGTGLHTRKDD